MSEPIRLTFVSDTTDEFPNNTNASFKVRKNDPERRMVRQLVENDGARP